MWQVWDLQNIVVAQGASKLSVFKRVRPCRELNPGLLRGLLNIRKMLQSVMYTQNEKSDLLSIISNYIIIEDSKPWASMIFSVVFMPTLKCSDFIKPSSYYCSVKHQYYSWLVPGAKSMIL